ncbi:TPA: hypothetical protein I9Y90_000054 [Elizabethkingia anophelis]|nr:hypothetical protein [Elizabethkingia anophelis]HAT4009577.1 hypothetical protein [Elizabethkingia anophelis]
MLALTVSLGSVSCSSSRDNEENIKVDEAWLHGKWLVTDVKYFENDKWEQSSSKEAMEFKSDNSFKFTEQQNIVASGTYKIIGSTISMKVNDKEAGTMTVLDRNGIFLILKAYDPAEKTYTWFKLVKQ